MAPNCWCGPLPDASRPTWCWELAVAHRVIVGERAALVVLAPNDVIERGGEEFGVSEGNADAATANDESCRDLDHVVVAPAGDPRDPSVEAATHAVDCHPSSAVLRPRPRPPPTMGRGRDAWARPACRGRASTTCRWGARCGRPTPHRAPPKQAARPSPRPRTPRRPRRHQCGGSDWSADEPRCPPTRRDLPFIRRRTARFAVPPLPPIPPPPTSPRPQPIYSTNRRRTGNRSTPNLRRIVPQMPPCSSRATPIAMTPIEIRYTVW